jgi:hypothetical protein
VLDRAVRELSQGLGIGAVLIRVEHDRGAGGNHTLDEFVDGPARGLGMGTAEVLLEALPPAPLGGGHAARAAQLGLVEAVDEVGDADQKVQVVGPVLAEFERAEAIEDQGFLDGVRA